MSASDNAILEAVSRLLEFRFRLQSARLAAEGPLFTVTFGAEEAQWLELALGMAIEALPLTEKVSLVRRLLGQSI